MSSDFSNGGSVPSLSSASGVAGLGVGGWETILTSWRSSWLPSTSSSSSESDSLSSSEPWESSSPSRSSDLMSVQAVKKVPSLESFALAAALLQHGHDLCSCASSSNKSESSICACPTSNRRSQSGRAASLASFRTSGACDKVSWSCVCSLRAI